jgi:hypothetical protein
MPVITFATCNKAAWERMTQRRQILENARNMKLSRVRQDIERISKRELDYAKNLLEELVPVKISWNEEAWQKLQESSPIRVEVAEKKRDVEKVDAVVVEEDEKLN